MAKQTIATNTTANANNAAPNVLADVPEIVVTMKADPKPILKTLDATARANKRVELELPEGETRLIALYEQPATIETWKNTSRVKKDAQVADGFSVFQSELADVLASPYVATRTTYEQFALVACDAVTNETERAKLEDGYRQVRRVVRKKKANITRKMLADGFRKTYPEKTAAEGRVFAAKFEERIVAIADLLNKQSATLVNSATSDKNAALLLNKTTAIINDLVSDLCRCAGLPYPFKFRNKHVRQVFNIASRLRAGGKFSSGIDDANEAEADQQSAKIKTALKSANKSDVLCDANAVKRAIQMVLSSMINGNSLYSTVNALDVMEEADNLLKSSLQTETEFEIARINAEKGKKAPKAPKKKDTTKKAESASK